MKKITILDYGLGNIRSLKNSLKLISNNVNYFSENPKKLANVMNYCKNIGTEDNLILTASNSKITFAGGGISFLGTSEKNLENFKKRLSIMSIGPNKLNQKKHTLFLKNLNCLNRLSQKLFLLKNIISLL